MSLYCAAGSVESDLFPQLHDLLVESLAKLGQRNRVLVVPPDHSRVHSRSGDLARYAWEYYGGTPRTALMISCALAAHPAALSKAMFFSLLSPTFAAYNVSTPS